MWSSLVYMVKKLYCLKAYALRNLKINAILLKNNNWKKKLTGTLYLKTVTSKCIFPTNSHPFQAFLFWYNGANRANFSYPVFPDARFNYTGLFWLFRCTVPDSWCVTYSFLCVFEKNKKVFFKLLSWLIHIFQLKTSKEEGGKSQFLRAIKTVFCSH
jgi:hypothetical protein